MKLFIFLLLGTTLFYLLKVVQTETSFKDDDSILADDDECEEIMDLSRIKREADAEPKRGGGGRFTSSSRGSYRSYSYSYRSSRRRGGGYTDNATGKTTASLNLTCTVMVGVASTVISILYLRDCR